MELHHCPSSTRRREKTVWRLYLLAAIAAPRADCVDTSARLNATRANARLVTRRWFDLVGVERACWWCHVMSSGRRRKRARTLRVSGCARRCESESLVSARMLHCLHQLWPSRVWKGVLPAVVPGEEQEEEAGKCRLARFARVPSHLRQAVVMRYPHVQEEGPQRCMRQVPRGEL